MALGLFLWQSSTISSNEAAKMPQVIYFSRTYGVVPGMASAKNMKRMIDGWMSWRNKPSAGLTVYRVTSIMRRLFQICSGGVIECRLRFNNHLISRKSANMGSVSE